MDKPFTIFSDQGGYLVWQNGVVTGTPSAITSLEYLITMDDPVRTIPTAPVEKLDMFNHDHAAVLCQLALPGRTYFIDGWGREDEALNKFDPYHDEQGRFSSGDGGGRGGRGASGGRSSSGGSSGTGDRSQGEGGAFTGTEAPIQNAPYGEDPHSTAVMARDYMNPRGAESFHVATAGAAIPLDPTKDDSPRITIPAEFNRQDVVERAEAFSANAQAANDQRTLATRDMTPTEANARAQDVSGAVQTALGRGYDTEHVYDKIEGVDGQSNVWTPERQALHEQLMTEFRGLLAKVPKDGKVIISGGLGGAGKSTTLRMNANALGINLDENGSMSNYATINPDGVKEWLVNHSADLKVPGFSPMEMVGLIHEESSVLGKQMMKEAMAVHANILLDITVNGQYRSMEAKWIAPLVKAGYSQADITLAYVSTTVNDSVSNAQSRWEKAQNIWNQSLTDPGSERPDQEAQGGRYVMPSIILGGGRPGEGLGPDDRSINQGNAYKLAGVIGRAVFYDRHHGGDAIPVWDTAGIEAPPPDPALIGDKE